MAEIEKSLNAGLSSVLLLCDTVPEVLQLMLVDCTALRQQTFESFLAGRATVANQRCPLIVILDVDREVLSYNGLLAIVRDCASGSVLLCSESIVLAELLALGFRRFDDTQGLYVFDLFDYKKRPDWFNADHFAHPHRWDPLG